MTTAGRCDSPLKALKRRRAELCADRNVWKLKVPGALHVDLTIGCAHTKPDRLRCEGCCARLHRADRLDEIAAGIKAIDAEITTIIGKPYGTARPKLAKTQEMKP